MVITFWGFFFFAPTTERYNPKLFFLFLVFTLIRSIIQVELILFVFEIMVKFCFFLYEYPINIYIKYFSFSLALQSHFSHEPRVCACMGEFSFSRFFMSLNLIYVSPNFEPFFKIFFAVLGFLFHISILELISFHEIILLRFSFGFL